MSVTHLATIRAEVRKVANKCDLGDFNAQFFLKGGFVNDIADLIQRKEQEAFNRGMLAARCTREHTK